MTDRPRMRCEHMERNPDQLSMYRWYAAAKEMAEYCLPCIVAVNEINPAPALAAGVLMEKYANSGRVLSRRTA